MRQGIIKHLCKTFEERQVDRQKKIDTKELKNEMIEEKKKKITAEKTKREEKKKGRMNDEYKTATDQISSFSILSEFD